MKIMVEDFGGIAPQVLPFRLADGLSLKAKNMRFERNLLESFRGLESTGISLPAGTNHIYKYGNAWMGWADSRVRAVDAAQVSDPFDYLLIADVNYPKITRNDMATNSLPYPSTTWRLGVPQGTRPATPPSVFRPAGVEAPQEGVDIESVTAYRFSFVNGFGFEGALSEPTPQVKFYETFDQVLVPLPTSIPGTGHYLAGAKVRVYRVNSFGEGYQMVKEVTLGTAAITDDVLSSELGVFAETENWFPPPDDDTSVNPRGPLRNLTAMPGGFFIGSTGDELCASIAGAPYAWPYRIPLGFDITGIAVAGNAAVVATTGPVFVVQGVDPSALQPTRINSNQACLSARSMVNVGGAVIYAAPDGLVAVTGYEASLITDNLVTKEEWQRDFDPSNIHAYYYENKYVFFNNTKGWVLRPGAGIQSLGELSFVATAGFSNLEEDYLYLIVGGQVVKFDSASARMTYEWESREFVFGTPTNFGYMQVVAATYPVTVSFWYKRMDAVWVQHTRTISNHMPVLLPAGTSYRSIKFSAVGTLPIQSIAVAHNLSEFDYV